MEVSLLRTLDALKGTSSRNHLKVKAVQQSMTDLVVHKSNKVSVERRYELLDTINQAYLPNLLVTYLFLDGVIVCVSSNKVIDRLSSEIIAHCLKQALNIKVYLRAVCLFIILTRQNSTRINS